MACFLETAFDCPSEFLETLLYCAASFLEPTLDRMSYFLEALLDFFESVAEGILDLRPDAASLKNDNVALYPISSVNATLKQISVTYLAVIIIIQS